MRRTAYLVVIACLSLAGCSAPTPPPEPDPSPSASLRMEINGVPAPTDNHYKKAGGWVIVPMSRYRDSGNNIAEDDMDAVLTTILTDPEKLTALSLCSDELNAQADYLNASSENAINYVFNNPPFPAPSTDDLKIDVKRAMKSRGEVPLYRFAAALAAQHHIPCTQPGAPLDEAHSVTVDDVGKDHLAAVILDNSILESNMSVEMSRYFEDCPESVAKWLQHDKDSALSVKPEGPGTWTALDKANAISRREIQLKLLTDQNVACPGTVS